VANTVSKDPKDEHRKEARVIDCGFHTASRAEDDGFSNTGKDINKIPQSKYRVEEIHLPY